MAKISSVAEREMKRVLEEVYCHNCESSDCGICDRLDKVEEAYENIVACLCLPDEKSSEIKVMDVDNEQTGDQYISWKRN